VSERPLPDRLAIRVFEPEEPADTPDDARLHSLAVGLRSSQVERAPSLITARLLAAFGPIGSLE
jgi:hypothetical protein